MPKNIVLLSDGTGNSAAKLFKTNVWRIYDCLDLRNPDEQVACYDDGVGTSTFLPLAVLGGAIGFGLKRNVLRLYRFLCEQYEPGDRIYLFGFSRGAFTIRMLVGLIADQGIIRVRANKYVSPADAAAARAIGDRARALAADKERPTDVIVDPVAGTRVSSRTTMRGSELRRLSKRAYQKFRDNHFDQGLLLVAVVRAIRGWYANLRDGDTRYDPEKNHKIKRNGITFVGVWDTVDAYGLPMDELTDGVNHWIWPLTFPDLTLSEKVEKACHAVSIDDERHTFHPVLWDESEQRQDTAHIDEERISQVWFAGVHTNVGGGYPNDALSAVSLDWMAHEAMKQKLLFLDEQLRHATDKRDPLGKMYDSRRGLGSYYRYNPRKIEFLTNGQVHEQGFFGRTWPRPSPTVTIRRPKIHESVILRIKSAPDFYAPISLPEHYAVVREDGRILSGAEYGAQHGFETPDKSAARTRAQEVAWNLVWWRRIAYFASSIATMVMVIWPLRESAAAIATIAERGGAARFIITVGGLLPPIAAPWVNYYAARPAELAVGLGILGLTLLWGGGLRARIGDQMHRIWRYVVAPTRQSDLQLPKPWGLLYHARQHPYYHGSFAVFRRKILPNAFGLLLVIWLVAGINRGAFEVFNIAGNPCNSSDVTTPVPPQGVERMFATNTFCAPTGIALEGGVAYEISVTFAGAHDASIPVTGPSGVNALSRGVSAVGRVVYAGALPFKRLLRTDYFTPVARVGDAGTDQVPLPEAMNRIIARHDGELFVFVNDAIAPLAYIPGQGPRFGWDAYYANNTGTAMIRVRRASQP